MKVAGAKKYHLAPATAYTETDWQCLHDQGDRKRVNTAGIIDDIIRDTAPEGVYGYQDLIRTLREKKFHGVAVSGGPDETAYLIFLGGEPEGAIITSPKGELYGDKAVYLMKETGRYTLYPVGLPTVEQLIIGCQIYNKRHFTGGSPVELPEIGKKAEGIGRLIIALRREGSPAAGLPVKIRRSGQIVATDITDRQGVASFRLMFGTYDLLVAREEQDIDVYEFCFDQALHEKAQELEIG
ncbi:MAG: hypothetical protein LUQ61_00130 [Methanoregulaceae archaeon]|nr:hypothetical protein [Methanoregulaceae archaeon]